MELALVALLRRLLSPTPSDRPTANAVLADPLFELPSGSGAQADGQAEAGGGGGGGGGSALRRKC